MYKSIRERKVDIEEDIEEEIEKIEDTTRK